VDTIVLGCTHFPLLTNQLHTVLPNVAWVDSGAAIAKRVHSLLNEKKPLDHGLKYNHSDLIEHQVYFSKSLPNNVVFKAALAKLGFLTSELHLLNVQ
jgi:glutamate racemase